MKARIAIIGDYEAESKTYGVGLIADESEVEKSPLKEGDEVEIVLIANAPGQVRRQLSPEPGCSEHDWAEETLHEPNFHVAYGAKRVCRKCGKQQFADYAAGRIGGDWVDVPNAEHEPRRAPISCSASGGKK